MNEVVKRAMEINEKSELRGECFIPDVEVGDICTLADIFSGDGDEDEILASGSYSEVITHDGEDGNGNTDIWINYAFEAIEAAENALDATIKITKIELL